jgi:hypothetical protein
MKPEDTANFIAGIGVGISVLSAGAAIMAIRSSRKTAKEQAALQAKLTAIEEERRGEEVEARQHARVTLSIPKPQFGKGDLVLTNEGPAVARSVTVEISSADEAKPPAVFGLERLPVDLWSGQPMSFDLVASWGDATLIKALVRWVDDAGSQEATYTLRTLAARSWLRPPALSQAPVVRDRLRMPPWPAPWVLPETGQGLPLKRLQELGGGRLAGAVPVAPWRLPYQP